MSLGRLVPWVSWAEWEQVCEYLNDDQDEKIKLGLDIVSVWRIRGRVPVGVDATALLTETIQKCVPDASLYRDYETYRSIYVNSFLN